MKAKIINGIITKGLPKYYKHWAGNFDVQSIAIHESEGFFDVEIPTYDIDIEQRGLIYWADVNKVFTYPITDKVLPTLEEAKATKIAQLKSAVKGLYQSIQWYLEMLRANNEDIPQAVTDKIQLIRTKYIAEKASINALTEVISVIKYELPYDAIATVQAQLDNIE